MLKLYLAGGLLAALAIGGLSLYVKGRIDASHAAEVTRLKTEISTLKDDLAREVAARKLDAMQAKTDREEAEMQDQKGKELTDALGGKSNQVFDARESDGLRSLIGGQQ